jgi:hypothetical protein
MLLPANAESRSLRLGTGPSVRCRTA